MKWFDKCKEYTSDMYPSLKFLYVILFILVSAIGWSVFDKNLVSKTVSPHPFKEQKTIEYYKITPEGLDLVEGNVSNDPGIIIPLEV